MKNSLIKILLTSSILAISFVPSIVMADSETKIEEQVLYDSDEIKITATGFEEEAIFGPEISLLIENNSDTSITIQPRNGSVNGYMADFQMSASVEPGKKSNDNITLLDSFEQMGVSTFAQFECAFDIFNSETYETIITTDIIPIVTNLSDEYVQEYDSSGDIMFDSDGIKIISKGLSNDSIWGPELMLYIENNTEKSITVQSDNTSINGFMVNPSMSCDITPGKKIIGGLTFFSSDLEENSITDITNLETSFNIFDADTYETIIQTPALTLTF